MRVSGKIIGLSFGGLATAVLALALTAQAQISTTGTAGVGPFTQGQVDAGRAAYQANCSGCHGPALQGGPNSTALAGPGFMAAWGGRGSADYYRYVSTQMPYGNAGGLDGATYTNIVAFIYAVNGATPGTQTLTADNTTRINSFTDGHIVDAAIAGQGAQVAAGRGGRGRAAPPFVAGQTLFGTVKH
jgi:mono/diheme cytochrome c family protein